MIACDTEFYAARNRLSGWRERSARVAREVRVADLRGGHVPFCRSGILSSLKHPAVGILPPPQRTLAMRLLATSCRSPFGPVPLFAMAVPAIAVNASRWRVRLDVALRATSVFD